MTVIHFNCFICGLQLMPADNIVSVFCGKKAHNSCLPVLCKTDDQLIAEFVIDTNDYFKTLAPVEITAEWLEQSITDETRERHIASIDKMVDDRIQATIEVIDQNSPTRSWETC